jgi:hypothetical protein
LLIKASHYFGPDDVLQAVVGFQPPDGQDH